MPEQPKMMEPVIIEDEPEKIKFYTHAETAYPPGREMVGLVGVTWEEFQELQKTADDLRDNNKEGALEKIRLLLGGNTEINVEEMVDRFDYNLGAYSSERINNLLLINYITANIPFNALENKDGEKREELAKKARPAFYEALAQAYRWGREDLQKELEEKLARVNTIIEENDIKILS